MPGTTCSKHRPVGLLLFLAAMALAALAPWAAAEDYERWYAVEINGKRAGWMHNRQSTAEGRITTSSRILFEIGRAQQAAKLSIEGEFVETAAGKPVSLRSVMTLGTAPRVMECSYGEAEMRIRQTEGEQVREMTRPLPEGAWLTPAAAEVFVRQRLAAGAETIEYRTIQPGSALDPISALKPITIAHRDCRKTTVEAFGKNVEAVRCITTTSAQAGVESVEVLDLEGRAVRSETTFGGLAMTARAVTREEAMADRPPVEVMTSTFVEPDKPIRDPRRARRAAYTLRVDEGKVPALPDTGSQRVEPGDDGAVRVKVSMDGPAPAPEGDAADPAYTTASGMINSDDERIKELTARALAEAGKPAAERAEALRRFVHRYIRSKNLGVGFATASEVARSRQGDCTEHAVLLAAMLRADGIPSRVACGLIYADSFAGSRDIFGYHMWTQALLEHEGKPTWIDLDAVLPGAVPYDATHITLAVTALADGQAQDALLSIVTVIGRLRISVVSVEHGKP